jgi:Tfp pilus assembly protein PilN
MNRLPIDFAPRTPITLVYRLPLWVWPVLLLGLVAALSAGLRLWSLNQRMELMHQTLADIRQRVDQRADKPRRVVKVSISPAQAATINKAVRQLNIPWSELLDALEGAASQKVALLEIRPEAATHRLLGVAEARNSDEMIRYIQRLKSQSMFGAVLITSHQVNEQDRNKPMRFEFSATWKEFQP